MIVHVYCSYKLSPKGFRYGTFKYNEKEGGEFYLLSTDSNSKLVERAFISGKISSAKGRMPNKSSYIYLQKGLKYTYQNHESYGETVNMNLAFEFENYDDFNRFAASFDKGVKKAGFSKKLADFIVPDSNVEQYALKIDKEHFDSLVSEMLSCDNAGDEELKDHILINTKSSEDCRSDLCDVFSIDSKISIQKRNDKEYLYPKKKQQLMSKLKETAKNPKVQKAVIIGTAVALTAAAVLTIYLMHVNE